MPFGAFVEVTRGVEGLLREFGLEKGQEVEVVVTEVDRERRRASVAGAGGNVRVSGRSCSTGRGSAPQAPPWSCCNDAAPEC
ncbi:hypothetical protein PV682_21340 [Streptomyces niveiscabiei]|uniref:hypothetical protein n=1 Tax=Streptomyces niveiscabiei TaxID=164115 RepID=UPI0029BC5CEA|nr:hypothetical protein [Streptomyces niveiscabiei]MDX3383986.1 hypothetical protein [Streptomyces niveiscabiei]